ncbi:PD-(D/E)XK nuclease superfamily protein [bacterium A37T11]|nr:PD-(D/E)XK nuclease superfamily protein [bacterium A37T11]
MTKLKIYSYLSGMKGLPIGLDSFEDFSSLDSIYVDKTAFIYRLMHAGGKTIFLSRPRRFGKSLLLSTIQAVFEGKKELFKGLFIEDKIDWETYPVISLNMTVTVRSVEKMEEGLRGHLLGIAANRQLSIPYQDPATILAELIRQLYVKHNKQVVVLVDECDKPILDSVDDLELANEIRKILQGFYATLKASSAYIRFVMLTGVSKISQTSLFSGFNQYNDITLNPDYAGICGYTQQELEQHFDEYVDEVAPLLQLSKKDLYQKIKFWYNGYSWDGKTFVYNPFSVLRLFSEKEFSAYWFATGTPSFLLKLLDKFSDYSPILADENRVERGFEDTQSLENMQLLPLFFQTGYLTIKESLVGDPYYKYVLKVPNEEVRKALLETLVTYFVKLPRRSDLLVLGQNLADAFEKGDTAAAIKYLNVLYSHASYHQCIYSEGYYHNLFEIFSKFAGIDLLIESRTDIGRVDSVLRFPDRTYIIEMKYAAEQNDLPTAAATALDQIKQKNYQLPYLHQGKTVHLLGLAFTKGGIGYEEELT